VETLVRDKTAAATIRVLHADAGLHSFFLIWDNRPLNIVWDNLLGRVSLINGMEPLEHFGIGNENLPELENFLRNYLTTE